MNLGSNFRTDFFNPPIPFLTGDASVLCQIISEVERVNSMDSRGVRNHQERFLSPLVKHFLEVDPSFRKRVGKRSSSLDFLLTDLQKVEPQGKEFFQNLSGRGEVISQRTPKHFTPLHWAETSGSTGKPLRIQNTSVSGAISTAAVPWSHMKSGIDFSGKLASVKPGNKGILISDNWDGATDLLFKVGKMLSISSSEDVMVQLDNLEKFKPDTLIVFPSVLSEYTQIWKRGVRDPLPLKMIRTMGETLRDETRDLAATLTGAVVLDTYSSSEIGRIATQVSEGGLYVLNNYSLIVEVLDQNWNPCPIGETGRVVVTDLCNYATPMIRYDIGDYAVPGDKDCLTLKSIRGRYRNMISLPDGRKIWPLVGYREFSNILPVRQFHIRQEEIGKLKASFYVEHFPSKRQEDDLYGIIRKSLGYDFEIDATYQLEPLEKGPNQKLEDFVSLVS